MAYDNATQQVILFGDRQASRTSETWAWTPSAGWKQLAPSTSPPGRTWGNMAYDDSTQQVVLFGGQSAAPAANGALNPLADTWTWDGTNWTRQRPAASPPATVNMSMAYDAFTQTVIGVRDNDIGGVTETWQWYKGSWSLLRPARRPGFQKQGAGIAYATATAEVTLFGTVFNLLPVPPPDPDTWTWASNTWAPHAASAATPKARSFPGMSEDTRGGVLMFGGGGSGFTVFGDTWSYYQHVWTRLSVTPAPHARTMAKMAYDSSCGLVLLYGGELPTGRQVTNYRDTWAWNGQGWTKVG